MKRISIAVMLVSMLTITAGRSDTARPNIIFLMADDQNTWSMGCYGNPEVQTPNLDKLSDDGVTFDRHYDSTAICMASRATVMTGMYEYKTGCNFDHGEMMQSMWKKSYPILLREAGYTTAFAGKFGFYLRETPEGEKLPLPEDDFDRWAGGGGQTSYTTSENPALAAYSNLYPHATLAYGAFGADFIRDSEAGSKPFCLSISFKAPHRPAMPDPRFDPIYAGMDFTEPPHYGRTNGLHFAAQSRAGRQYERFTSWHYDDEYDRVMRIYNQQVYGIDVAVGMIRNAVEAAGVASNTVIIYTSDNGFFCGAHGYGSKVLPYEDASRVPLIIYDPRHPNSGKKLRSASLSGNVDFAPTILSLAGLPVPDHMDGRNLMTLYSDPSARIHDALPLINVWGPVETHVMSVVSGRFKYINWRYAGDGYTATEELYDLNADPLELINLAVDPAHRANLEAMRGVYDQQLEHWKSETVPYNNYQKYGTVFDRTIDWSVKKSGAR